MERITEEERASIQAASQEVSLQFRSLIDSTDVDTIKHTQHQITMVYTGTRLGRLQDSTAVLSHFNEYSERCYSEVSGEFVRKTRLLKSVKSDLDHIFTKLRSMKARLKATYPDAFPDGATSEVLDERPDLDRPVQ